jgi:hypothetical protein
MLRELELKLMHGAERMERNIGERGVEMIRREVEGHVLR